MSRNRFLEQTDAAMERVSKILDLTRNPRYAEKEDHTYDDKFGLAEFVTNSALAAQINALERMGLGESKLHQLVDIVKKDNRTVTLRFAAEQTCEFIKEKEVEIESPRQMSAQVTETTTEEGEGTSKKMEKAYHHKVVTKVKEYHWKIGVSWSLFAFAGNESDTNQVVLQSRESSTVIITTGNKKEPLRKREKRAPIDVTLTWLLQNLSNEELVCCFRIDRSTDTCRTPRRNDDINAAYDFFSHFKSWSHECREYFLQVERHILGQHKPAGANTPGMLRSVGLTNINAKEVFVPVLPLMEAPTEKRTSEDDDMTEDSSFVSMRPEYDNSTTPLLSVGDINKFLQEQCRSLDEAVASLTKAYPTDRQGNLLCVEEATVVMVCMHLVDVSDQMHGSVRYLEQMLRDQLVAAIGKEVQPKDFEEFLRFHNQKLLGPNFSPKPFCYAIRRPNHYPDGLLSIEVSNGNDQDKIDPIETIVRKISGNTAPPMFFPINAATVVEFTGERYLHAWIQHRFLSSPRTKPQLVARARQFSSFLLMIGTISGPDKFDPKDAIIVQNKDEVLIPLLLNELPTPKEFKDAISSLSPEQQRFAKSFRGMQLESSVFGVCVVQLKPQLEVLLALPPDALTKEIGLTQDLLSLFIEYQIPSDLLSFDGPSDSSVASKLETVKDYVKRVQDVIDGAKKKQLEDEVKKADMQFEKSGGFGGGRELMQRSGASRAQRSGAMAGFPGSFAFGCASPPPPSASTPYGAMQHGLPPPQARKATTATYRSAKMVRQSAGATMECDEMDLEFADEEDFCFDDCADDVAMTEKKENKNVPPGSSASAVSSKTDDFTAIPNKLNKAFDKYDEDNALHTTTIKTDKEWTRQRQENLLTKVVTKKLLQGEQKTEKNRAFDLLDALSRSGSLPVECAELHVVLGVTHCFEKTVMSTVIEDNVNPIEKMENSTLLIASMIHNVPSGELTSGSRMESARLASQFPPSALPESTTTEQTDA